MKRKLIGFITAFPEAINVQRLLEGVFSRCAQLDYDVAVISPMSQVCIKQEDYLAGELNIYNLINFDLFDGIIIEGGSLVEDGVTDVLEALLKLKNDRQ